MTSKARLMSDVSYLEAKIERLNRQMDAAKGTDRYNQLGGQLDDAVYELAEAKSLLDDLLWQEEDDPICL